jgi:hypothetical protein
MGKAAASITPSVTGGANIHFKIDSNSWTAHTSGAISLSGLAANQAHTVQIAVTPNDGTQPVTTYTITVVKPYEYTYTSSAPYTWTAPAAGTYQFELWGAEGGSNLCARWNIIGGKGGYIKAQKHFNASDVMYLYAGQQGNNTAGLRVGGAAAYGGGGKGGNCTGHDDRSGAGGGGATFVSTAQNTSTAYDAVISNSTVRAGFQLVAGGGGGGGGYAPPDRGSNGGRGSGTDTGGDSLTNEGGNKGAGASPTTGNANGVGGSSPNSADTTPGAGGGGNRGGVVGVQNSNQGHVIASGGGGGSGYINTTAGWTLTDTDRTGNVGTGAFKNIPEPGGGALVAGHSGAGFIRIICIGQ